MIKDKNFNNDILTLKIKRKNIIIKIFIFNRGV